MAADEFDGAGHIAGKHPFPRRVSSPQQRQRRHAGVGDIRRVLHIGTLDTAPLVGGAPAAPLPPAAIGMLLLNQIAESLLHVLA